VYWIPLYDILEERGFESTWLTPGTTRKSARTEERLQEKPVVLKLHTYGLLNNSFQPSSKIRILRTYWRQRYNTSRERRPVCNACRKPCANEYPAGQCDQRSEWGDGTADCAGHRCRRTRPQKLHGTQSSTDSSQPRGDRQKLEGNWRELIFVLQQEIEMYDTYQRRVAESIRIAEAPARFCRYGRPSTARTTSEKEEETKQEYPHFRLADELQRITGVVLTPSMASM